MSGKLAGMVEDRLSYRDGRYAVSCDDGDDYFEVSVAWTDGSEEPDLLGIAGELLPVYGFSAGWMRRRYGEGGNTAYLYCEEDTGGTTDIIEEALPELLESGQQ